MQKLLQRRINIAISGNILVVLPNNLLCKMVEKDNKSIKIPEILKKN